MPTKTISTFNGATQGVGAGASLIIGLQGLPLIQSIKGYCNGTQNTQYFIQIHQLAAIGVATLPSNGAVPLWCQQVLGGDGFVFNDRPLGTSTSQLATTSAVTTTGLDPAYGLVLILSTTEATLTIGTGGVTMDAIVDIDSGDLPILGEKSVIGSNVNSLIVVADPTTKKLTRVIADNNTGATGYLMLFGKVPTAGDKPVLPAWKVLDATELTLNFGAGGYRVAQVTNSPYAINTGIYLYTSTTGDIYTASAASWVLEGFYIS